MSVNQHSIYANSSFSIEFENNERAKERLDEREGIYLINQWSIIIDVKQYLIERVIRDFTRSAFSDRHNEQRPETRHPRHLSALFFRRSPFSTYNFNWLWLFVNKKAYKIELSCVWRNNKEKAPPCSLEPSALASQWNIQMPFMNIIRERETDRPGERLYANSHQLFACLYFIMCHNLCFCNMQTMQFDSSTSQTPETFGVVFCKARRWTVTKRVFDYFIYFFLWSPIN